MHKGYKIRIYPTKEQERIIWQHFGACRFMWNYMLNLQKTRHEQGEPYLRHFAMCKLITKMKSEEEYSWLYNVSNHSLQKTCTLLDDAYQRFFKGVNGYPKFKSKKHSKKSYPLSTERFRIEDNYVRLQKIGNVKYKTDLSLPIGKGHKFSNVQLYFINNKYMVSFAIEGENQAETLNDFCMGIDLGIKELAVVAYDDKKLVFGNINKSNKIKNLNKEIIRRQKNISRKYEQSRKRTGKYEKTKNIIKEEIILRKLHAKISNIRDNYIHQVTHDVVELKPRRIVVEDLSASDMIKNKHLRKAVLDQCFYIFLRRIQYKAEWKGIEFVKADKYYPSSKTCSCCGNINKNLKLSDRTYNCNLCGLTMDRDYNAAINLMRYEA